MAIFGVICLIVLVGAAVLIYLYKKQEKSVIEIKILYPDVVEDTIEETQKRVKAVKKRSKRSKSSNF